MQDTLKLELQNRTKEYGFTKQDEFTSTNLASDLGISRNTASQYLNQMVKNNEAIKINTRPVYFYSRNEIEELMNIQFVTFEFNSFEEVESLRDDDRSMREFVGAKGSLHSVVQQGKAAINYPGHGLPILIHGETGTGKTMIASLLYDYAIENEIIEKDKKFVSLNCSEYANNPELLTSNLFGHVKGAFTDAHEDNKGLIEVADGGILFLDEVHCLPAESQEKLFYFMDKGIYHQVGDNEKWLKAECRLIFATTENPQDSLLKTLLRRIPIIVHVPSLDERPLLEKRELIYTMFKSESQRLDRDLVISNTVYQILMDISFIGNVGGMKNTIKAACATAFLNKSDSDEVLQISIHDLPNYVFETVSLVQLKEHDRTKENMLTLDQLQVKPESSNKQIELYDNLLERFSVHNKQLDSFAEVLVDYKEVIKEYIDYLFYNNQTNLNLSDNYILHILDKIYSIIINKYSVTIPNSEIKIYSTIISEYAKLITENKMWISSNEKRANEFYEHMRYHAPKEVNIAREIANNIKLNLDIEVDAMMLSILAITLVSTRNKQSSTVALILCHGYSTASSIASAANQMLGEYIFDGIDMELSVSSDKIVKQIDSVLKQKMNFNEIVLLVDMGSLEEIHEKIQPLSDCMITIINNVNTKLAIEVGSKIKRGIPMITELEKLEREFKLTTKYLEGRQKQKVIMTICFTGIGTAKKISELLYKSIPSKVPTIIIPCEYDTLMKNGLSDPVFHKYDVSMIIGTVDPQIQGVPFISVEDLMMNKNLNELVNFVSKYISEDEVKEFHNNIMKNFTLLNLVNYLTVLNAEKVLEDVEDVVSHFEDMLKISLDPIAKAGLYVHLSCLIERLMLKNEIVHFDNMDEKLEEASHFVEVSKEVLSVIENRYSVEVPDAEILLINNYFTN